MQTQTQILGFGGDDALDGLSDETKSLVARFIKAPSKVTRRRTEVGASTSYVSIQRDTTTDLRDNQVSIRLSAEDVRDLDRWGAIDADDDVALSSDPNTGEFMLARVGTFPNMAIRHLSKSGKRRALAASSDSDAEAMRRIFGFRYGTAEFDLKPIFDTKGRFVCALTEYSGITHMREALNE